MSDWFSKDKSNEPNHGVQAAFSQVLENTIQEKQALYQDYQRANEENARLKEGIAKLRRQFEKTFAIPGSAYTLAGPIEGLAQEGNVGATVQSQLANGDLVNREQLEHLQKENALLLTQVHQTQEELEQTFLQKQQVIQDKDALATRLSRLTRNYPHCIDYQKLELVSFDRVDDVPQIVWKLHDCAIAQSHFHYIQFAIIMAAGKAALRIISHAEKEGDDIEHEKDNILMPDIVRKSSRQQDLLMRMESVQWYALKASISAIELSIQKHWMDVLIPKDFDVVFWTPALQRLIVDFRVIPPAFRYDRVRLKREVINADYENLWLEFYGVTFDTYTLPKMELRIGASEVDSLKFSTLPKLEFPLIDSTQKPFESWYAEGADDFGEKLEIRFDLKKKSFDLNVWAKISVWDRSLIYGLVAALPFALVQLEKNQVTITRKWNVWQQFVLSMKSTLSGFAKV